MLVLTNQILESSIIHLTTDSSVAKFPDLQLQAGVCILKDSHTILRNARAFHATRVRHLGRPCVVIAL